MIFDTHRSVPPTRSQRSFNEGCSFSRPVRMNFRKKKSNLVKKEKIKINCNWNIYTRMIDRYSFRVITMAYIATSVELLSGIPSTDCFSPQL